MLAYLQGWETSFGPASRFMQVDRTEGIVAAATPCWRRPLTGRLFNQDTLVGRQGTMPVASTV